MNIPQITEGKINKLFIKKHYPEFYEYLLDTYKNYNYTKFTELIYCYQNDIKEHPLCPICGKELPFLDFNRGYQKYCSLKCSNLSPEVQEKKKQTSLKNYGVEHAAQAKEIKDKMINTCIERHGGIGNASESTKRKQFQTMKEKYGSEHALQNESLKEKAIKTVTENYGGIGLSSDIIREKVTRTNIERYGVENTLAAESIKDKIKQTNLEKYGYENATQNLDIKKKIRNTKRISSIYKNDYLIDIIDENDELMYKIKCPHPECNKCNEKYFTIKASYYQRRLNDHTEICTNLFPICKPFSKDTSLEVFIRNILDDNNIQYISNDRTILNGKEIDIYIPDKKIGIECNGVYWHSLKDPNYHMDKWRLCKEQDIQLLNIWQDWIINKPEIVKSIILSKLGIYKEKIYARKCIVKEIDSKTCNNFLNENHIQGAGKSKIKLGLYYNDKLVCVMTFNKENKYGKKNHDYYFELTRFCTKKNIRVIGGAGKLLKYFINNYHPIEISTFASNDISDGRLYKSLNFQECGINKSYWYIDKDYNRFHKFTFTKDAIIKKGWKETKDGWKEKDVMYEHGYLQIYDSGQTKYILY